MLDIEILLQVVLGQDGDTATFIARFTVTNLCFQAFQLHQSGYTVPATGLALFPEILVDLAVAIDATALQPGLLEQTQQPDAVAQRVAPALAALCVLAIFVLSFQGPEGGLTFPMRGVSLHWFEKLWEGIGVVDIGAAFRRSLGLGATVMVLTVVLSLLAGLAYRKKLPGGTPLFYVVVASLIMPSIIVSLGIGLEFRLLDAGVIPAELAGHPGPQVAAGELLDGGGGAVGRGDVQPVGGAAVARRGADALRQGPGEERSGVPDVP